MIMRTIYVFEEGVWVLAWLWSGASHGACAQGWRLTFIVSAGLGLVTGLLAFPGIWEPRLHAVRPCARFIFHQACCQPIVPAAWRAPVMACICAVRFY